MFGIGMQEILLVGLIIVVIFGATRLPQIGEGMGKMITNFRKAIKKSPEKDDSEGNKGDRA